MRKNTQSPPPGRQESQPSKMGKVTSNAPNIAASKNNNLKTLHKPNEKKNAEPEVEDKKSNSDSNSSSSGQENTSSSPNNPKTRIQTVRFDVTDFAFLDKLIIRLMSAPEKPDTNVKDPKKQNEFAQIASVQLSLGELEKLCEMAIQSFKSQSTLLIIDSSSLPINIVGDVHGQFNDLRGIFHRCGAPNMQSYLFLGDYIDRGIQGIETFALLTALKIKYPDKVYMLRGNHEDANTCASYGFLDECIQRYTFEKGEPLWRKFIDVFNWIPLAALLNKSVFCMHGGISPHLQTLDEVAKIQRPSIVPPYGLACDLVWADPNEENLEGWAMSKRGVSVLFSQKVVETFCQKNKIDLIVRGHQLTRQMLLSGYRFHAKGRVVTIFSAPNYLNMKNAGCVLKISKNMKCRFVVFRVNRRQKPKS
ncbi:Serine/threonine-protein phosphatase [Aphelenchoides bicaudatus]|nr:Serine/threonine-protein phosphatase [Aphelenchoides bicaudatus]